MKGLKEYLKKHGKHFTEQLAYDAALNKRWDKRQIENSIKDRVWYNVTDSSIGDIIYLVNECYDDDNFMGYGRKSKCISYTLLYIGNFKNYGGKLFKRWLREYPEFDFTPYI